MISVLLFLWRGSHFWCPLFFCLSLYDFFMISFVWMITECGGRNRIVLNETACQNLFLILLFPLLLLFFYGFSILTENSDLIVVIIFMWFFNFLNHGTIVFDFLSLPDLPLPPAPAGGSLFSSSSLLTWKKMWLFWILCFVVSFRSFPAPPSSSSFFLSEASG